MRSWSCSFPSQKLIHDCRSVDNTQPNLQPLPTCARSNSISHDQLQAAQYVLLAREVRSQEQLRFHNGAKSGTWQGTPFFSRPTSTPSKNRLSVSSASPLLPSAMTGSSVNGVGRLGSEVVRQDDQRLTRWRGDTDHSISRPTHPVRLEYHRHP